MELIKIILPAIYVYIYSLSSISALSCLPCDEIECSDKTIEDCPAGIESNVCGCCVVCSKDLDEKCGGPFNIYGNCGKGLICNKTDDFNSNGNIGDFNSDGICVSGNQGDFIHYYERFIVLDEYNGVKWDEAQTLCKSHNYSLYELAQPGINISRLASYLLTTYGRSYYWLGGRGTCKGLNIAYLSGEVIPPTSLLWRNEEAGFQTSTDYCLYIRAVDDGSILNPLGTWPCDDTEWMTPLCEARKFIISSETFIVLNEYRGVTWSQAQKLCKRAGYILAEPEIDETDLATYLHSNFGLTYYWLGGKGQGSYIAYNVSGVVIDSASPLWRTDEAGKQTSTDFCMYIRDDGNPNPLGTYSCQDKTYMTPLCGELPILITTPPADIQLSQMILDQNVLL